MAKKSSKGKKEYVKTHTNPRAAIQHVSKIKKRGGTVKSQSVNGKMKVTYKF